MRIFPAQLVAGDEAVMAWIRDHGLDPHRIAAGHQHVVGIDDDGNVHLEQYDHEYPGKRTVVDNACVTESVVVTPTRPFPTPPGG